MVSELALDINQTTDPRFMRILDISWYNPNIAVTCEKLIVTPPGAYVGVVYPVRYGFNEIVNTLNLYQTQAIGDLPDGVYFVTYSIAPNDKLWVEYAHLRTTRLLQRYYKLMCSLQLDCKLTVFKDEQLKELRYVKSLIDAAKSYVEYCGAIDKGRNLYSFAVNAIDKLECELGADKSCTK